MLKLKAQATAEIAIGGNKDHRTVPRRDWDVSLSQQVAHIRLNRQMTRENVRERLADLHTQVGVDVVERLAVGILMRHGWSAEPLVACRELRAEARDSG